MNKYKKAEAAERAEDCFQENQEKTRKGEEMKAGEKRKVKKTPNTKQPGARADHGRDYRGSKKTKRHEHDDGGLSEGLLGNTENMEPTEAGEWVEMRYTKQSRERNKNNRRQQKRTTENNQGKGQEEGALWREREEPT